MTDVTIPHFALPFRIAGGAPVVNEQDTDADIRDCVEAIVRTPLGARLELPEFGRPDETFTVHDVNPAATLAAVEKWEPRAIAAASAQGITPDDYVAQVTVEIERNGT